MTHDFLALSMLCCLPGGAVYMLRRDLRSPIRLIGCCAVPFAFTERFFYPSYWEPRFLWDLADKIGFGLEDLLFVIGLGALTMSAYPFCFRKRFSFESDSGRRPVLRLAGIGAFTGLCILLAVVLRVPMIYGAAGTMAIAGAAMTAIRRDLLTGSLWGGAITCAVYFFVCLVFSQLFRNAFSDVWHGERFSGVYLAGILLEEYVYGFTAGLVGTAFYPFVSGRKFVNF